MLRSRLLEALSVVAVATGLGLLIVAQDGLAKQPTGVPARMAGFCRAEHISCQGHWTRLGGRSTYVVDTPLAIDSRGHAYAAAVIGRMKNEGVGLCMDSLGQRRSGSYVKLEPCNRTAGQYWYGAVQALGGIELVNGEKGSWCLTNSAGRASNWNPQTLWPCRGTYWQQGYVPSGGVNSTIKLAADGKNHKPNGYCVTNGGSRPGSRVTLYRCTRSRNEYWSGPIVETPS